MGFLKNLFAPSPLPTVPGIGKVKHLIAVASGKGGVGKSMTSALIALALKEQGWQVAVFDADVYGPSLQILLPPIPARQYGPKEIPEKALPLLQTEDGIGVMSLAFLSQPGAPHILRGPMAGNVLKQILQQTLWGELDAIIVDYPPGTGDIQLTLSQSARFTGAVLVTTPQELSLSDAKKAAGMFHTVQVPILGVVQNMTHFNCPSCHSEHLLFPGEGGRLLAQDTKSALLEKVPFVASLAALCDSGLSLLKMTREPIFECYRRIAKTLSSDLGAAKLWDETTSTSTLSLGTFSLTWQKEPS